MTKDEQRIAIATAVGWVNQGRAKTVLGLMDSWRHPQIRNHVVTTDLLPDYLTDLNAMAIAEAVLVGQQRTDYINHLFVLHDTKNDGWDEASSRTVFFPFICSTAAQRAEAFLRAIGAWRDEQPIKQTQ